jgi:hypothetical protein
VTVAALGDRLSDRLNPIVVKELRQAVQSKFVVGVLLLFLLVQVSIIGIALVVGAGAGNRDPLADQSGWGVFAIIQSILLATCMLVIPAYTGVRLAAERSDVNVDLLFITTLKPRAIISGKLLAALVLVVLIFSACTPFMVFSYLLRGVDVLSIALVLLIDLGAIAAAILIAIFLAVVPANRVFKIILGLVGFIGLLFGYSGVLPGTTIMLERGGSYYLDSPGFWAAAAAIAVSALTFLGLFYAWSVALISPPSANRSLGVRLFLLVIWLATGVVFGLVNIRLPGERNGPLLTWLFFMAGVFSLNLIIVINEREHWGPRVARSIPRRWWLRWPVFLFYSGAAGGVIFSVIMLGLTALAVLLWNEWLPSVASEWGPDNMQDFLAAFAAIGLYTYAYALTAVLVRRVSPWKIPAGFTWIVWLILVAVGSTVPYLISFLLFYRDWNYESHFGWLLSNPFVAVVEVGDTGDLRHHTVYFLGFAGFWAGLVTLFSVPWFVRQFRHFRPYASQSATLARGELPLPVTAAEGATTRTAGKPSAVD